MLQAILFGILLVVGSAAASGDWSYHGDNGPAHWDHVSANCGGNKQSPIDIRAPTYANLGKFTFAGYSEVPTDLELANNGHAIQVNVPQSRDITVSGGGLVGTYKLVQFHMHWGSVDCMGSEHTVFGKHYPLEIHYVHYNTKYTDLTAALAYPDGVAVLGVFVDTYDKSNKAFNKITDQLAEVRYSDGKVKLAQQFALDSFLPANKDNFIRYSGSLTTPNCNEVVTWTLFNDPILISHTQMNAMRAVSFDKSTDEKEEPMVDNYRPTLALNGRAVTKSFTDAVKLPSVQTTCGAMGNHHKSLLVALAVIVGAFFTRL